MILFKVFGQQWQHVWPWDALRKIMKWGELKPLLPQLIFFFIRRLYYSILHLQLHDMHIFFTSVSMSICVIKMHLVSYSCLEKGKFTLPKKVMFNQNKGHLRGFPHPNPSKWAPLSELFFSLQIAWELVVKSREKSVNTPFKLGHLQLFKRPKVCDLQIAPQNLPETLSSLSYLRN